MHLITKIVVEIPNNDNTSGGVNRMLRFVTELPYYSLTSGGIRDNIRIAKNFDPKMIVRFQNIMEGYPILPLHWTVGRPDHTFPQCDICITYSDNPYTEELVKLPQIGKVFILMLSYGMNLPVERRNVLNKKLTVLCSSKKIEKEILKEGVIVHRIGIALDMSEFYLEQRERKNYLAILYNDMETKKYGTAVKIASILYRSKIIDGVISFGKKNGYESFKKPEGLVKHYSDATPVQIREIFNTCKCYLIPSVTEGINLTPIESTMCGCPAIICDGAIDEIFFHEKNCFIVPKEDVKVMVEYCTEVIENYDKYAEPFRKEMIEVTKEMTWGKVMKNLIDILC